MNTKMRIRLYDKEEKLTSDRLVAQGLELVNGPNAEHDGPISLELNLRDANDVDLSIEYLKKLSGKLPIIAKTKNVRIAKGSVEADNNEPLQDLIVNAAKKYKTQEELITFLREQNFYFISSDMITEGCTQLGKDVKIKKKHEEYQFMIRLVKAAKDPKNDKYDSRLLIGIKIYGERYAKFQVYLFGQYFKTYKMEWAQPKKINFKKPEKLMSFPVYMDYEDRAKWRTEWRKMQSNPEHVKSKFYLKHEPFVTFY